MEPEYLECQQCGDRLYELSNSEAQRVARQSENYIVYCKWCKKDIELIIE